MRRDLLEPHDLDRVHEQGLRILEEVGTEVHSESMLERLRQVGQRVDGTRVYWDPSWVMSQLKMAPSTTSLTGRGGRRVHIGGGSLVHTPVGGSPFVSDLERGRREGSLDDYVELVRLGHVASELPVLQSGTTEAQELSYLSRHLDMDYACLRWSDKPFILYGTSGPKTRDGLALASLVSGGDDRLRTEPRVMGIVNPNSPLVWDELMVDTLVALAEFNQPVAITPFLLAGASAPVSLAAGVSLLVAETLSGIAMAQLIRPGAPCILGTFFNGVDMRSGGPSPGLPESVLATLVGGQLARRYDVPLRGGGGLCAGMVLDAQAATESVMSLWATYLAECDLVLHAAGWLEGGLTASYEKFALDLEVIRMFNRLREGVVVDDEQLAFDVIADVGPGGLFLAHEHTLEHFRSDLFMSPLFRATAYPTWEKQGSRTTDVIATDEWKALLAQYEDPGIDDGLDAELLRFVEVRAAELDA